MCPIRSLTPEVESVRRWFGLTYGLVFPPMGVPRYQRVSWPAPGGPGDQDAWLTQALDAVCQTENAMIREAVNRNTPPSTTKRNRR